MPEITEEEFKKQLDQVSTASRSRKVVFPHGLKIVDFNGEKVIQPLTPQEYRDIAEEELGLQLSDEEIAGSKCFTEVGLCHNTGCKGYCKLVARRGGFICICIGGSQ